MNSRGDIRKSARKIGEHYQYESGHSNHVASVAVMIFDALEELHGFGERERLLLEIAGLLHDIGWIDGQKKHHKKSQDLILTSELPGVSDEELTMIALTARYHRRALPKDSHRHYSDLSMDGKHTVRYLSAFLRLADGLDRTHLEAVSGVTARVSDKRIVLEIKGEKSETDRRVGKKKADLLEIVTGREVEVKWE